MTWGLVAVAGATLVGGAMASNAAGKAADAQIGASKNANDLQKYMYDTSRADQAPYREQGTKALGALSDLSGVNGQPDFSKFYTSPGYQFRLDQGNQAVERSAAARGGLLSGATMKALTKYSQGVASDEYGNYTNRLASLAGIGQTATNATNTLGANYANAAGENMLGAANARASGYIGGSNAINSGISQGLNFYQNQQMINKMGSAGSNGYGAPYQSGAYANNPSGTW